MRVRQIATSVAVLVLAGGACGLAVATLPKPEGALTVPVIENTGDYAQALCPGGFERTFGQGVDVTQLN